MIAELNFVFWQKMFTDQFDQGLWNAHLLRVLPNLDAARTVTELRRQIYASLDEIRQLRNRIAHHEPVFARDLATDLRQIANLIRFRSTVTSEWMMNNQQAGDLIARRP